MTFKSLKAETSYFQQTKNNPKIAILSTAITDGWNITVYQYYVKYIALIKNVH